MALILKSLEFDPDEIIPDNVRNKCHVDPLMVLLSRGFLSAPVVFVRIASSVPSYGYFTFATRKSPATISRRKAMQMLPRIHNHRQITEAKSA